jgi:hypothetical protein
MPPVLVDPEVPDSDPLPGGIVDVVVGVGLNDLKRSGLVKGLELLPPNKLDEGAGVELLPPNKLDDGVGVELLCPKKLDGVGVTAVEELDPKGPCAASPANNEGFAVLSGNGF